jgi:hypothetical protein
VHSSWCFNFVVDWCILLVLTDNGFGGVPGLRTSSAPRLGTSTLPLRGHPTVNSSAQQLIGGGAALPPQVRYLPPVVTFAPRSFILCYRFFRLSPSLVINVPIIPWVLQHCGAAVLGSSNRQHLRANLETPAFQLSPTDMALLNSISRDGQRCASLVCTRSRVSSCK